MAQPTDARSARPKKAVFHLPWSAVWLPLVVFVCSTPLATVGPAWTSVYALTLFAVVLVVLTRTSADAERVKTWWLLRSNTMAWTDLDRLEFAGQRWAVAVSQSGRRLRLPSVRPRDVPRLISVTGSALTLGAAEPEAETSAQDEQAEPDELDSPAASEGETRAQGDPDEPDGLAASESETRAQAEPAVSDNETEGEDEPNDVERGTKG